MKISVSFLATAVLSTASAAVAQESLEEWWSKSPFTIFPNHTGWDAAYDDYFHPDLKATFNFVDHDFNSLKAFFTGVFATVESKYEYLQITPVDYVVLPGKGLGGLVSMTGTEVGKQIGSDVVRSERDAVFAVIDENRKVTEWREYTNFF